LNSAQVTGSVNKLFTQQHKQFSDFYTTSSQ